jgi:hypothetical protein
MNYLAAIISYYECPDDHEKWVGLWDCGCDSPCPKCSDPVTPYLSISCRELEDVLTAAASGAPHQQS